MTVTIIPLEDLAVREESSEQPPPYSRVRAQEVDLPQSVSVAYMDPNLDYQVNVQMAQRVEGSSQNIQQVSLAIAITPAQAATAANHMLYGSWQGRSTLTFTTSYKYAYLEPTDLVYIADELWRLTARDDGANGIIQWQAVSEDVSIWGGSWAGISVQLGQTVSALPGNTVLRILDIPLLRDEDNSSGFYAAMSGASNGWKGAALYKSVDAGGTWGFVGAVSGKATVGYALTALGNFFGGNIFDELNSVTVQLSAGELASATEALVLAGSNACLLGNELLQFKTATAISENTYSLTGLLRGKQGTQSAMSAHTAGEAFVLLDTAGLLRVPMQTSEIGLSRQWRAPTAGNTLTSADIQTATFSSNCLKPVAPVDLRGDRHPTNNDYTLKWGRSARYSNTWRDFVDAALGEATEAYEVEVYSSGTYTTLKRTITATASGAGSVITPASQIAIYKSADQVTDFGSDQSTLYVKIYQLSAVVGRGNPLTTSITR